MNASYEWLRAFVPLAVSPGQLRDLLTAHTATVDDLVPLRSDLAAIVVGRVVDAARHPDSDHLWVTKVDAGTGELLDVVCGAPNVAAGKLYPFAPVGTVMPSGMKIERRKIRGSVSNGMLCSARELGLGDNHEGILELEISATPGTPFLKATPVGDTRVVVDVGANRPDLLSHLGLARELSAITGKAWRLPDIENLGPATPTPATGQREATVADRAVRVDADTATRRYMGAVVRGVKVAPSPAWLVKRLEAVDVRPINNVVDATNYVLHELGQPIHAFDLSRLSGGVIVRRAKDQEKIVTLDGVTRSLKADDVVIADDVSAQAIAGVIGGRDSEIGDETRDLFIEVASFDPRRVRATRKAHGISTDASYRFERGVDPELAPLAMDRVVRLIVALAGGSLGEPAIDIRRVPSNPVTIALRPSRIAQVLGDAVSTPDVSRYLKGAGFEVSGTGDRTLSVQVPGWRPDVVDEIDLVEEVARFHGYDRFPDEIRPFRPTTTFDDPMWLTAARLRDTLVGLGLLETRPMPFVHGTDESHVRVGNPLSENEAYLRRSILESLARRLEHNLAHRSGDLRLFEVGSAFERGVTAMPREEVRLGVIIMGRRRPPHFTEPDPPVSDEWDAKGIAETAVAIAHPAQPATLVPGSGDALWHIEVNQKRVGVVSRVTLDAPVWASPAFGIELVLGDVATASPAAPGTHAYIEGRHAGPRTAARYAPLPVMPAAEFDLALLVPAGTTVADVERVVRASAGDLLEALTLFDEYTGPGIEHDHRSLAWRLTFRHPERTLRDKEIEGRRNRILGALQQELNVRQRTA